MTDEMLAQYRLMLAKCEFLESVMLDEARFIQAESWEELDLILDRKSRYIQNALKLDIDLKAQEDSIRRDAGADDLAEVDASAADWRARLDRSMGRVAEMQNVNRAELIRKQEAMRLELEDRIGARRRAEAYIAYGDL